MCSSDTREPFWNLPQTSGSDRMVTSAWGFTEDGGIEGESERHWRWCPEGGRDEEDIKRGRGDREAHTEKQAIRDPPHLYLGVTLETAAKVGLRQINRQSSRNERQRKGMQGVE